MDEDLPADRKTDREVSTANDRVALPVTDDKKECRQEALQAEQATRFITSFVISPPPPPPALGGMCFTIH